MRCLSPEEVTDLFGPSGFSAASKPQFGRTPLVLRPTIASRQARVGGRPSPDVSRLRYFAAAINRWHSSDEGRLLWVDNWENNFPSIHHAFVSVRAGLGEVRSLSETPGHLFGPYPYHEQDQTVISPEHARTTGILIGLMSLMMIDGWDGWLLAKGSSDQIEFWEGNIFFYSTDKSRLKTASALMDDFECPRDPK